MTNFVDETVDVIDFVAQSQQLILTDIGVCIKASQEQDHASLDKAAAFISGRVERIHDIVKVRISTIVNQMIINCLRLI